MESQTRKEQIESLKSTIHTIQHHKYQPGEWTKFKGKLLIRHKEITPYIDWTSTQKNSPHIFEGQIDLYWDQITDGKIATQIYQALKKTFPGELPVDN